MNSFEKFKKITVRHAYFHLVFVVTFVLELLSFLIFFPFFSKSSMLAFSIASLFLTGFSYCVLIFYFQAKKPEQFLQLRKEFIELCKANSHSSTLHQEDALYLSHAAIKFVQLLGRQEALFYPYFEKFETLFFLLKKFSLWFHWKDRQQMKELLLFFAIQEHIALIKNEPINLKIHASLAETYCFLSKIYLDPGKTASTEEPVWIHPAYASEELLQKFRMAAERAIEELKILNDYAPNDHWIHYQLSRIYHDLEMPKEEILEVEKLLKLSPKDKKVLHRLGVLYFQQGLNAKGLRIYEQLKHSNEKLAADLISHYDSYTISEQIRDATL